MDRWHQPGRGPLAAYLATVLLCHPRLDRLELAHVICRWAVSFYRQIKWWIPKKTQAKIALLGGDFEPALLRVMPKETLDSMLGAFE